MYKLGDITNKILLGNCLEQLKLIENDTVHSCITSPPYFNLRNYESTPTIWGGKADCNHQWEKLPVSKSSKHGPGSIFPEEFKDAQHGPRANADRSICTICNAYKGELGQEQSSEQFINNLLEIFKEVYRVLKSSGTCYINLDDTYASKKDKDINADKKSLLMIPERFALGMIKNGWILRNKIIWHKKNSMPESVNDRFSTSYEYFFFFTKSPKYFFEQQYEPLSPASLVRAKYTSVSDKTETGIAGGINVENHKNILNKITSGEFVGRNKRDVFIQSTTSFSGAHFATFGEELILPLIESGCPLEICSKCHKPRKKVYKNEGELKMGGDVENPKIGEANGLSASSALRTKTIMQKSFAGYTDCGCNAPYNAGIVLDPFMGAGTTALLSRKTGRNYIGIEINEKYKKMAEQRLIDELGFFV